MSKNGTRVRGFSGITFKENFSELSLDMEEDTDSNDNEYVDQIEEALNEKLMGEAEEASEVDQEAESYNDECEYCDEDEYCDG